MASAPRDMALRARAASRQLVALSTAERVAMLERVAEALLANEGRILAANKLDIEQSEARRAAARVAMRPIDGECGVSALTRL
jgi:gamma-glutamyl phosphate reductase